MNMFRRSVEDQIIDFKYNKNNGQSGVHEVHHKDTTFINLMLGFADQVMKIHSRVDFESYIRPFGKYYPSDGARFDKDNIKGMAICEAFREYHKKNAKLELIDSDDPLDAGLDLLFSPPGKRLQSITLLSGGEQALTALSLIFAVFLTNPAPICVLDEVDAPLDDANVTRFCNLLEELTKITSTKFIIVTHHALTMSKMDRLYGVTMPEKGISQLVSVDLQKAESLVA